MSMEKGEMIAKDIARKKAELINYGKIYIPKGFALPFYPSRSTAGPGAGKRALVFSFHNTRVKLSITRDPNTIFSLIKFEETPDTYTDPSSTTTVVRPCIQGKTYCILKHGKLFLNEVSLEPTIMHAPYQAFINLTSKCIYDCSFCVTPTIDYKNKSPSPERWVELILIHAENRDLEAVAITSGVESSSHETVLEMVKVIKGVRDRLPDIPIGVEPYLTARGDVEILHQAGANEIKINLETPNREIFKKICRGLDYDGIDKALDHAVSIFGKNNVCTNLIVGLGETDAELLTKVEELASRGIVATLRGVRANQLNKQKLNETLGFIPEPVKPERLLNLAEVQKVILEKYGLTTEKYKTMCHRCKCCDIVPQQDL